MQKISQVSPPAKQALTNPTPPLKKSGKANKRRRGRAYPAPEWSARLYVRIEASKVHMFRFLLEAEDNLGIMSVVDRWGAVLQVRFSPHQERTIREFLEGMRETVPFEILPQQLVADWPVESA